MSPGRWVGLGAALALGLGCALHWSGATERAAGSAGGVAGEATREAEREGLAPAKTLLDSDGAPREPGPESAPLPAGMVAALERFSAQGQGLGESAGLAELDAAPPLRAADTRDASGLVDGKLPELTRRETASEQREDALRWFAGLPESGGPSPARVEADRRRLGEAGMDLTAHECRGGVCRLSVVYSPESSARYAPRLGNDGARAQLNAGSWSFTTLNPDGRVEADILVPEAR